MGSWHADIGGGQEKINKSLHRRRASSELSHGQGPQRGDPLASRPIELSHPPEIWEEQGQ